MSIIAVLEEMRFSSQNEITGIFYNAPIGISIKIQLK